MTRALQIKSTARDCCHCSRFGADCSHARRQRPDDRPGPRPSRDHRGDQARRPAGSSPRSGHRPLASGRGPGARHGVVGGLPVLRQPRRAAHGAHRRGLRHRRRSRRAAPSSGPGRASRSDGWRSPARSAAGPVAHPHDYSLVYGSPVPGYRAPEATIAPAERVSLVALRIIHDGVASGRDLAAEAAMPMPSDGARRPHPAQRPRPRSTCRRTSWPAG